MLATCSEMRDVAQSDAPATTVDITKSGWGCVPPSLPARMVTMVTIAQEVADKYGLSVSELKGLTRLRYVAWPRQEFMWRCRQIFRSDGFHRYSLPQIGRFLGGRDHTTCVWGVKRHIARIRAAQLAAIQGANDASALANGQT